MKKYIRRTFAFLALAPLALGGQASATSPAVGPDAQAWEEALQKNSVAGFAEFAMTHPESQFAKQAHARILSGADAVRGSDASGAGAIDAEGLVSQESAPEIMPDSIMVV